MSGDFKIFAIDFLSVHASIAPDIIPIPTAVSGDFPLSRYLSVVSSIDFEDKSTWFATFATLDDISAAFCVDEKAPATLPNPPDTIILSASSAACVPALYATFQNGLSIWSLTPEYKASDIYVSANLMSYGSISSPEIAIIIFSALFARDFTARGTDEPTLYNVDNIGYSFATSFASFFTSPIYNLFN